MLIEHLQEIFRFESGDTKEYKIELLTSEKYVQKMTLFYQQLPAPPQFLPPLLSLLQRLPVA